MKSVLVTAFEPFGGETLNPTEVVLNILPDRIGEYAIHKLLLPVEYAGAAELAIAEYDDLQPKAVIMLGQAGGRSAITPEATAKNLMNSAAPDNSGYKADHELISESGPDTLNTSLPIEAIVDALTVRGIPCEESGDAGTFVCNALFYKMLEHNHGEVPTGFVHVPFIAEQEHSDKPFMELKDIQTGVETILETLVMFKYAS